jgi:hypothetical protein
MMQPWFRRRGKANERKPLPSPSQSGQFKLPIRAGVLLSLAQYVALADAALLAAAHLAVPLILASVVVAFIAAYHFFDGLIE